MTYASATAAGRSNYRRNQNSVNLADSKSRLGPVSNFVVLLVLMCLLFVVYLSQITRTSSYSYTLDALNSEKTELQERLSSLQVESARMQSLERVRGSEVASNLSEPTDIIYAN